MNANRNHKIILLCVVGWLAFTTPLFASSAFLVKDINPNQEIIPDGPRPYMSSSGFTNLGSITMFVGWDPAHSWELWKTDPAQGPSLVMDINPGPEHSYMGPMTAFNSAVFFAATSGKEGRELWKSDGTSAGTKLVKDIYPDYLKSSDPSNMTVSGGYLFFTANSDENGPDLWKTDGTPDGTVLLLKNCCSDLTDVNGTLFFVGPNGLWKTDGTQQGTLLVKQSWTFSFLTNVHGILFFNGYDDTHGSELWKSDGTDFGTVIVKDIYPGNYSSDPAYLTDVNGVLYFAADDGIHGDELWMSDGTDAGTQMVSDIVPGIDGSFPRSITNVNSSLYFVAREAATGDELWKSDGSAATTHLVKDLIPGSIGSRPDKLTAFSGLLCFVASDFVSIKPWRTDGTEAGTYTLEDLSFTSPFDLTPSAGYLYFSDYAKVWQSDGTQAGTTVIYNSDHRAGSSSPIPQLAIGSTLYFSASDGEHGTEPWITDGTIIGTRMLKDIWPGEGSSTPDQFTDVNGTIFFSAADPVNGNELWKTDGTEDGTLLVKVFNPSGGGDYPGQFHNINGILLFGVSSQSGLWRSDGTEAGTYQLYLFRSDGGQDFFGDFEYMLNGELYFKANDGVHGTELWKTDGTAEGTVLVSDINPGPDGSIPTWGFAFLAAPFGSSLLFSATDGISGNELWKSDGSTEGTVQVSDINPGPGSSDLKLFSSSTGVFLQANDGTTGSELWHSDGTNLGTFLLADIYPGPEPSTPERFREASGITYFSAYDPIHGEELWKSDGTSAGTAMIQDLNPGITGSMPQQNYRQNMVSVADSIFFVATDGLHGAQPWRSRGTQENTIMEEINPDEVASVPNYFVATDSLIYFSAFDRTHGTELWAIPISTIPDFVFGCGTPPPIMKGSSAQITCEVRTLNSPSSNVDFSCSDLPPGVTCVFTDTEAAIMSAGTSKVDMDLQADTTASPGRSVFEIHGTNGIVSRTANSVVEVDLLYDNFLDGYASDWIVNKGNWNVVNGYLNSMTTTMSRIYSPALFTGCSRCAIEATVKATSGAIISLIGWHKNSKNYIQLDLNEKKNKILLTQKKNGNSTKRSVSFSISPGMDYRVMVTYDGANLNVFVNQNLLFSTPAVGSPSGNLGLRVQSSTGKNVTGQFTNIRVTALP